MFECCKSMPDFSKACRTNDTYFLKPIPGIESSTVCSSGVAQCQNVQKHAGQTTNSSLNNVWE